MFSCLHPWVSARASEDLYGSDMSLCNHWPCALEPTPSFNMLLLINWWAKCLFSVLSRLLSSLWVSHAGSASEWRVLREALYKCTDTIQCLKCTAPRSSFNF